ncbi:hypothetical protein DICPUDRAFT_80446 [Dictyostelium purpureum]|uniref:Uncharacterized protein n=1 Tax=Dictyostelium purpureum TaxID=5786 RepID=F0ZQI1_DICPU|nr:uncharacterized protein DICPUDRAFT_80446 [Dictyostelium purpureum]EGC33806.1 hypothetical protein DICPUDRAFT_80446 [Dictyostelium purpureum]|eukprot:XP_003289677.1 hypothetical protein DICPUDRAFT_80446 [Dictyostelium purpureum]
MHTNINIDSDIKNYFTEPSFLFFDHDIQLHNLLDPSHFLDFENNINNSNTDDFYQNLKKEHSWQNLIFSTNPIRVDNTTLLKNPEICKELAKDISYYNQTLIKLINIRKKEGEDGYDKDKWDQALEKLKKFLYSQIRDIIENVPHSHIPEEAKDYIDHCISQDLQIDKNYLKKFDIPQNILNNYIFNRTKKSNKK